MRYLALCLLATSLSTPAFAEKFISVALSNTTSNDGPGAIGIGVADTRTEADEVAIITCRKYHGTSCQIVAQQKGGCVALAKAGNVAHYGVGLSPDEQPAIDEALRQCSHGGRRSGCSVTTSACFD